jgi:hypothetical protein
MPFFRRKNPPESTASAADTSTLVVPGLEAHAASAGWSALGAKPFSDAFDDFITEESLALVGEAEHVLGAVRSREVNITTYHSAYGGALDGMTFTVANASTTGYRGSTVSVAQYFVPVMKLIDVTPHGAVQKPWGFKTGDDAFDTHFKVSTRDDEFARGLFTADVRALLLQRSDWGFMLGFYAVVCVCADPFDSVHAVDARLAFLQSFAAALPAELVKDAMASLPKRPDGTIVDVTKSENIRDALLALTPAEQSEFLDQFKHMTPEKKAEIMAQVQQHQRNRDP